LDFESKIFFETEEGNKYALQFSRFNIDSLPIQSPVIQVDLISITNNSKVNSTKTFNFIAQEVKNYLIDKPDTILYYYCDNKEIFFRKTREIESFQKFRSNLFSAMFHKINPDGLLIKSFIINDKENGNHFISFIFKDNHTDEINILAGLIENFHKEN